MLLKFSCLRVLLGLFVGFGVELQAQESKSGAPPEAAFSEPALAEEILARMERDQKSRMQLLRLDQNDGPERTPEKQSRRIALVRELSAVDTENREWMKKQIAKFGWPGKSLVGETAAHAAWLLVQHADAEIVFQKDCLARMKAAPPGEVAPIDIACLTDRVLVGENLPQVYGTQCRLVDGEVRTAPCTEPEMLDERRKSINLPPLAEYMEQMRQTYRPSTVERSPLKSKAK